MQIKKINNNKLKVILSSNDLDKKNIDIDSFLSNSIESQDLFFEILDLAEEEYNFNIENNKAVVETISLDNNLFVLTITKLKNNLESSYKKTCKLYRFENVNDILNIYYYLNITNTNIYVFSNNYYILFDNIDKKLENILLEYAIPINNYAIIEPILIEYGKKIK